jgi:hypothetical protein
MSPATGTHYSGRVEFDLAGGSLVADLTVRIDPAGRDSIPFLLSGSLDIGSIEGPEITGWESEPMSPGGDWNTVTVALAEERTPGLVEMTFHYAGAPSMPESRINQINEDWVELSVDSAWHPVSATLADEFTIDVELGLPLDWTVVAPGTTRAGETAWSLTNDEPHADIVFVAAPDLEVDRVDGAAVYHRGASQETTRAVLTAAALCREYLDGRFGVTKRLPDANFVIPDRDESGYARKNFISLTNVDSRNEASLTGFLCHELAHFWSSGAAPLTVDNWLNEGFATLVAAQAVRDHLGDETWKASLVSWTEHAAGQPSIWRADNLERRPFEVNYRKAPLALTQLEGEIGTEAFDRLVVRYMTDPINDTPSLLAALAEEAGDEARAWFEAVLARDDSADDE